MVHRSFLFALTISLSVAMSAGCSDDAAPIEGCSSGQQDNDGDGVCEPTCEASALNCGSNGRCIYMNGTPTCACNDGFQDNDGDGMCASDCGSANLTCGDNAMCSDINGTATCECIDSFQDNDGDGDCFFSCSSGALICGENTACVDESGAAECVCVAGFQDNDGDGDCAPDCASAELACDVNATCFDDSGMAECVCDDGFQDNDGDETCSANCETANLTCSTNAECSDDGGMAECICSDGFQDNDGDGVCLEACDPSGTTCGLNGICRDETGTITCLPVMEALVTHYDAQNSGSIILDSNDLVTQWSDLSGNGHHLTVNGINPTYDVDINNRAAVSFDGGRALTSTTVPLENELTVFAVIRWRTSNRWGSIAHHGHRDTDWALEQNSARQGTTHFQSRNDNNGAEVDLIADANYILVGKISGNTRTYSVHSAETGTEIVSATGVTIVEGIKTLYLGKSEINEASNVYIGEFVYYSRALSAWDEKQVTGYLRERWGIDENLAMNKRYAYELQIPGHDPAFYRDDPHVVHVDGLGAYSPGDLTDGVLGDGATDVRVPSPVVGLGWTGEAGSMPTDVIIDLETISAVRGIVVGTSVRGFNGAFGGAAPDDVNVSFSMAGDGPEDFSTPVNYPLWDFASDTLDAGGHFERYLQVETSTARYVKLSFDGSANGNRYMLDEVRVLGVEASANNLSIGKEYSYGLSIPGQDSMSYLDDSHRVHASGLGLYSVGELTDGAHANGITDGQTPSPVVGLGWTGASGSMPVEVVIDLERVSRVFTVRVGTSVQGSNGAEGGTAPDDVDVSFSTTASTADAFGSPTNFSLWPITDTLDGGGHFERKLFIGSAPARFVRLTFDGTSSGSRFMLDEITIVGVEE